MSLKHLLRVFAASSFFIFRHPSLPCTGMYSSCNAAERSQKIPSLFLLRLKESRRKNKLSKNVAPIDAPIDAPKIKRTKRRIAKLQKEPRKRGLYMYNTDPPPRCQGTETNLTTKKLGMQLLILLIRPPPRYIISSILFWHVCRRSPRPPHRPIDRPTDPFDFTRQTQPQRRGAARPV